MELYLFRHGIAEDVKPGHSDAERALTDEGRHKVADVIRTARRAGVDPSLILSSRLARAIQTAEAAAELFGYKSEILRTSNLAPHGSPEKVWDEIREHKTESSILLASHEPLLSHLVSYLLASPSLAVEIKKAALVRIDVDSFGPAPHGTLRWMIAPKLCR